jgi:tocopherol O-methyltransferase
MSEGKNGVKSVPSTNHIRQVISYYEDTKSDYRLWWMTSTALAMHFGFWDARTTNHAQALINLNRVLAARAKLQSSDRVLDAGCGVGGSAIWLAGEFGVPVVGVSLVPSEIDRGRQYARQRGVADRVTFERQDMVHTTFPDASFDVIWAIESVCHVPDKHEFLVESRRLLRPGGRLVIADGFRSPQFFNLADERLLRDWLSGWAVPDLATTDELTSAACRLGFAHVQVEDATINVWPSAQRMYHLARVLYPLGTVKRALGFLTDTQLANRRSALRQYRVLQRNLLVYGIVTATL